LLRRVGTHCHGPQSPPRALVVVTVRGEPLPRTLDLVAPLLPRVEEAAGGDRGGGNGDGGGGGRWRWGRRREIQRAGRVRREDAAACSSAAPPPACPRSRVSHGCEDAKPSSAWVRAPLMTALPPEEPSFVGVEEEVGRRSRGGGGAVGMRRERTQG
jgi:hypothetical protein